MKALEFYCGIGGLHYAFDKATEGQGKVLAAFDINDTANDVYQHNFKIRPRQVNIEKVSCQELDKYKADIWMLSPPCQPYTRQGHKKDTDDNRATNFLKLIDKLNYLQNPPKGLLVENVVGFEASNARNTLFEVLQKNGFQMLEFVLSPILFGIPYSRPRYFCIAFKGNDIKIKSTVPICLLSVVPSVLIQCGMDVQLALKEQQKIQVQTVENFLIQSIEEEQELPQRIKNPSENKINEDQSSQESNSKIDDLNNQCQKINDVENHDDFEMLRLPKLTIQKCADVMDLATPFSKRINCFTKSYSQYTKGTGSILATQNFEEILKYKQRFTIQNNLDDNKISNFCDEEIISTNNQFIIENLGKKNNYKIFGIENLFVTQSQDVKNHATTKQQNSDEIQFLNNQNSNQKISDSEIQRSDNIARKLLSEKLETLNLRYFSPREIANFHSFPASFTFPKFINLRQRYQLLGNSLSVVVVADLLKLLFKFI